MKISILPLCLLCCFGGLVMAQPKHLKIGDTIPNITIDNIVNSRITAAKIGDYKSKLLILDFWATYCTPCVASLPEFDALQKSFEGKVQFLLVTTEKGPKVAKSLSIHRCGLPSVTGDTVLNGMFDHSYIPHEVWIMNGVVIAFTQPWVITKENIQRVLTEPDYRPQMKNDLMTFDADKPLLINGNGGDGSNLIYHSILAPYIDGIPSRRSYKRKASGEVIRFSATNAPIAVLYQEAFRAVDPGLNYDNRLVIDVRDSMRRYFDYDPNSNRIKWLSSYGLCYELALDKHDLFSVMREDLNRCLGDLFNISGRLIKQEKLCWVISPLQGQELLASAGGKELVRSDTSEYVMKNMPFKVFLDGFLAYNWEITCPIISEVHGDSNIDLTILGKSSDMPAVKRGLNKIGLDINLVKRQIDMLLIAEKDTTNLHTSLKP
jgi:thiol-disulfide isomerase/thioredoxin